MVKALAFSFMLVVPAMAQTDAVVEKHDRNAFQLEAENRALRHVAVLAKVELLRLQLRDGDYLNSLLARKQTTSNVLQRLKRDYAHFKAPTQSVSTSDAVRNLGSLMDAQTEHTAVLLELMRMLNEEIERFKQGEDTTESRFRRLSALKELHAVCRELERIDGSPAKRLH